MTEVGNDLAALVASRVVDVSDFPQPGIVFKDISPLLTDPAAFRAVVDAIVAQADGSFDEVAGIEARGFLFAAAVGYAAGAGVVPVRKAGKLPRATHAASYELEYGEATLEVHQDAFGASCKPNQQHSGARRRVLIVDDVLATGGTLRATADLVERAGASVAGVTVLLELGFLDGRSRLAGYPLHALLTV